MKRINNLYNTICNIDNLMLADSKARKGKSKQYGVKIHDRNREDNILKLHHMLLDKTYTTSEYTIFKIKDPKERIVYRLPYFPDRIVHHAIMNVMEPIFISIFTSDTYSCIKGRGINAASIKLKEALKDVDNTKYCLKLDIKKFYESIDHEILKLLLRKKIKDKELLWLLDDVIDSAPGLPIGNYLSQYLSNFYLSYFDHHIKEVLGIKYYFRYADDIVILADNKAYLHDILHKIKNYFEKKLKLTIKKNYRIFPVDNCGIDFLGYVYFHTHVLVRKKIKKRFAKMLKKHRNEASISSYKGWIKHCNGKNLLKKLLYE